MGSIYYAGTIVRNSAGDARVIWSIFSGYHPQGLRESGAAFSQVLQVLVFRFEKFISLEIRQKLSPSLLFASF